MAAESRYDEDQISGINVTPLVDITLVLLIVFMVTARFIASPAIPLPLPSSSTSTEVQTPFSLELSASGEVRIGDSPAPSDAAIVARAQEALARTPDLRALIRADRSVPHGRVIRAIDLLKQAGVTRIAFAVAPGDPGALVPER